MRFRGRVAIGKEEKEGKKVPNGKYFLDVPTCRPILPSDMHPDAAATLNTPQTDAKAPTANADLLNALILVKGSKDITEAAFKLAEAKAPHELSLAFQTAMSEGKITFPI